MIVLVIAAGLLVLALAFVLHLRMHAIRDRNEHAIAVRVLVELERRRVDE